ncbi:MAG: tRNA lysidine(34) synthetase TilS [Pseudomonadales bacterium]
MEKIVGACDALLDTVRGRVWVGFSGGRDSTVLLHALARSADRVPGGRSRLTAVHVNHGLAPASADWVGHCEGFARTLGIDIHLATLALSPGANLEAQARSARYRVFRELLAEDDVLALAHHADDQVESVLLHLFQGRGLYGMPAERALGAGRLVRPLLSQPRSTLESYATSHALDWVEDPSNEDQSLDRNFLRHRVVPDLAGRFPELPKRLARLTETTEATALALEEALSLQRNPLPLSVLDGLSRPVRQSVLRHWLVVQDAAAGVSDGALADFLDQLESANDRQPSMSIGSGRLARFRRQLYLVDEPPVLEGTYPLACPGELLLPHGRLRADLEAPGAAAGQVATVALPLHVTFTTALPAGCTLRVEGKSRKVRELMRLAGVPPWARGVLPLVADAGGVAVVPGVAVRDTAAAPAADTRAVRVSWEPAAGTTRTAAGAAEAEAR